MLSRIRYSLGRVFTDPIVRFIAKAGLTPNSLTIIGFLLNAVAAWVLATGHLFLAGFLVLFSGWFDLLDGALARAQGKTTRFGALLDSTLDRYSEAILLLGLMIFYVKQNTPPEILLIYAAMVGSVMVSYIRTRTEGLGMKCEAGLFTRPERVILLALGLILSSIWANAILIVLWILAVGTNLTASQRLLNGWQQTKKHRNGDGNHSEPDK